MNAVGINNDPPPKALGPAGTIVAVVFIVLWAGALGVLYFYLDEGDKTWSRLSFIFNSIEAVAFAAAGALLGTQVQRARTAEKAEKDAKNETAQEKEISEMGASLASTVLTEGHKSAPPARGQTEFNILAEKSTMPQSMHRAQELLEARKRRLAAAVRSA